MAIENVSDTARWVAYYRARETQRPDALFHDPFAIRLAGPEADAIMQVLPKNTAIANAIVIRTVVMDEIILDCVTNRGVDTVINLAAGLDSRPWRMALPPSLRWVDVDLPGILDHKTNTLAADRTVCLYEAVPADLTVPGVADALFARLGAGSRCALVITEGLLIYLKPEQVAALGRALHVPGSFAWWLTDLASADLLKYIDRSHSKFLQNAPFQFGPKEGTAFFTPLGWHESEYRSTTTEARQRGRPMPHDLLFRIISTLMSAKRVAELQRFSGIVLFKRSNS